MHLFRKTIDFRMTTDGFNETINRKPKVCMYLHFQVLAIDYILISEMLSMVHF